MAESTSPVGAGAATSTIAVNTMVTAYPSGMSVDQMLASQSGATPAAAESSKNSKMKGQKTDGKTKRGNALVQLADHSDIPMDIFVDVRSEPSHHNVAARLISWESPPRSSLTCSRSTSSDSRAPAKPGGPSSCPRTRFSFGSGPSTTSRLIPPLAPSTCRTPGTPHSYSTMPVGCVSHISDEKKLGSGLTALEGPQLHREGRSILPTSDGSRLSCLCQDYVRCALTSPLEHS